ncbi:MAG TPA: hypothetical protein DCO72_04660 [Ruminococcus sp.]|nr:hypothetical protein [Ruminococcus sp.]
MLSNVRLKKFLKTVVFKPLTVVNKMIPKRDDYIVLYIASMGIRHSLKPLLDYLIENGYNKKYHIICGIEDMKYKGKDFENVTYMTKPQAMRYFLRAKHVYYTAGQIPIKPSKQQRVIHLTHGAVYYKAMGAMSPINNGDEFFFNYIITTSEYYRPILAKSYLCSEDNVAICNEPVTDMFYRKDTPKYDFGNVSKVLVWIPTFRQSDSLGYNNSSADKALLIFDESDYSALNDYLKERNMILIVKLHPAQNISNYHLESFSNLQIYTHGKFIRKGYEIYNLMKQSDALIGDYSSASLQYLLLNRPVSFVVPDLEDYQEHRGFIYENPLDFMPGHIIRTKEQFYQFIDDMAEGKDPYREQREKVRDLAHKYQDGNACKRVLELGEVKL